MTKALAYLALQGIILIAVVMLAAVNLMTRCEGFGCTGLGVSWMAFAVLLIGSCLAGLFFHRKIGPSRLQCASAVMMLVQIIGGLVLMLWWAHIKS